MAETATVGTFTAGFSLAIFHALMVVLDTLQVTVDVHRTAVLALAEVAFTDGFFGSGLQGCFLGCEGLLPGFIALIDTEGRRILGIDLNRISQGAEQDLSQYDFVRFYGCNGHNFSLKKSKLLCQCIASIA